MSSGRAWSAPIACAGSSCSITYVRRPATPCSILAADRPRLASFPESVAYTGFDRNEAYIARAKARFGPRATFVVASVAEPPALPKEHFDIVMALGVMHHLDDLHANQALAFAHDALKSGGRFISFDPVLDVPEQSRMARFVISQDRGRNVRGVADYLALARMYFGEIKSNIRHDLIRIPYTHLILECRKDGPGDR
jgi:SAM-dependent methyltransferase